MVELERYVYLQGAARDRPRRSMFVVRSRYRSVITLMGEPALIVYSVDHLREAPFDWRV